VMMVTMTATTMVDATVMGGAVMMMGRQRHGGVPSPRRHDHHEIRTLD
jgi:hypothetical protein